ncbi:DUF2177 family protein [Alteromonas sediminis]|uniref:DUF2177 family protein n=1 Tax=Alteromonas sediminis TaxID=2259342 RepID=A0A3N5XZA6_9ALTE|nr:DUF2177 family protein [Alteromonas sediminis]RPJ65396.1 DUF2177 family protein [Alteromonas sediminis]
MLANIIRYASNIIASCLAILLCFGIMDAFWLGWFATDWYQDEMQGLLRAQFITWPWVIFYLMYSFVLFVLSVVANRDKPIYYAGIDGALLGLASYGAYNLTNYSIIEGFSFFIMAVDWTWGVVISSVSAMAGWVGFQMLRKEALE